MPIGEGRLGCFKATYRDLRKSLNVGAAEMTFSSSSMVASVLPSNAWLTAHTVMLQSSGKRERDDTKNKL